MLKDNTDVSWQKWAESEPYFAVCVEERFRQENMSEENRKLLFNSGEEFIENLLNMCKFHFGEYDKSSAIDFGCGVGRLLVPLANRFTSVVGVDVSSRMLEICMENCEEYSVANVDLLLTQDLVDKLDGEFSFINSYIVFQHIEKNRGYQLMTLLMQKCRTGGIISMHFPIYGNRRIHRKVFHELRKIVKPIHYLKNIVDRKSFSEPLMQMNIYDLNKIVRIGRELNFNDFYLHFLDTGHTEYVSPIIISRKG